MGISALICYVRPEKLPANFALQKSLDNISSLKQQYRMVLLGEPWHCSDTQGEALLSRPQIGIGYLPCHYGTVSLSVSVNGRILDYGFWNQVTILKHQKQKDERFHNNLQGRSGKWMGTKHRNMWGWLRYHCAPTGKIAGQSTRVILDVYNQKPPK